MKLPFTPASLLATILRACTLSVLLVGTVQAQTTVTALAPARNALAIPRATNVTATFSQALRSTPATQQALRVFSQQAGGRKAGTATVSGNQLIFDPTTDFQAGETVRATLTGAAQGSDGAATKPQVFQFTTATAPSTGTFTGGQIFRTNRPSVDVATGDLNGDGKLDIVTADSDGNTLSILLNNADGTFPSVSPGSDQFSLFVGQFVSSITLGDVDSDGDLDIVATNYNYQPFSGKRYNGVATVFLNKGDGTFTRAQDVALGIDPTKPQLGDIDGDGDLDLVVISTKPDEYQNINVRLNNGQGNFSGTQNVPVIAYTFALADVDGDGDLDLLSNNYFLELSLNNGQGVFTNTKSIMSSTGSGKIAVQDLDGDGDLDILLPDAYDNSVGVILNSGSGTFTAGQQISVSGIPADLATNDIDGDGDVDLLTISGAEISVRLNDGRAGFSGTQEVSSGIGGGYSRLLLADVDNDLDLDILSVSSQKASVRLNQGSSTPSVPSSTYHLNAGGPGLATTATDYFFAPDQYYSPSSRTATTSDDINGTNKIALYQTERYSTNGTLSYAVPVVNGRYQVVLHFAEIYWTQPGQRVFNISLEGETKLTNYDIVREVGPRRATTKTFLVSVTDGIMNVDLNVPYLSGGRDQAKLSALEIVPVPQLNAGGPALTTSRGAFAPDQYYHYSPSSRTATTSASIAGTPDPALYQTERYSTNGTLSYAVPVVNGRYQVVLHFAEIYWTQPGQRVFDVALEGQKRLTNYDIVAKVGPLTATTETFDVDVFDNVLNVDLSVPYLTGGRDQAKLSALEIIGVDAGSPALSAYAVSASATLAETPAPGALRAYPNPSRGDFTLTLTSAVSQAATLTLTDRLGRMVQQQSVPLQVGVNQVVVRTSGLSMGMYQCTLCTADGKRQSQKVALQP